MFDKIRRCSRMWASKVYCFIDCKNSASLFDWLNKIFFSYGYYQKKCSKISANKNWSPGEAAPFPACTFNKNRFPSPRDKALSENPNDFINHFLLSHVISYFLSKELSSLITTSCTNIAETPNVLSVTKKKCRRRYWQFQMQKI